MDKENVFAFRVKINVLVLRPKHIRGLEEALREC